jgi:hypothetical protein
VPPVSKHATDWQVENWDHLGPFYAWRCLSAEDAAALGTVLDRLLLEIHTKRNLVRFTGAACWP